MSDTKLVREIARHLLQRAKAANTIGKNSVLVGLESGSILMTALLSYQSNLPCVFVRKEKCKYGTKKDIEGGLDIEGRSVVLCGDVLASGETAVKAIDTLTKVGAVPRTMLTALDMESGGFEALQAKGVGVLSLFTLEKMKYIAKTGKLPGDKV